ncbi:MAG: hypothetical protein Q9159_003302 [Coniocarpon cinnabarinum]
MRLRSGTSTDLDIVGHTNELHNEAGTDGGDTNDVEMMDVTTDIGSMHDKGTQTEDMHDMGTQTTSMHDKGTQTISMQDKGTQTSNTEDLEITKATRQAIQDYLYVTANAMGREWAQEDALEKEFSATSQKYYSQALDQSNRSERSMNIWARFNRIQWRGWELLSDRIKLSNMAAARLLAIMADGGMLQNLMQQDLRLAGTWRNNHDRRTFIWATNYNYNSEFPSRHADILRRMYPTRLDLCDNWTSSGLYMIFLREGLV